MELAAPDLKDYANYRSYLADFFTYKKSTRSGFSFRRFSTLVGLKSPNYLQLVMQGKRNLSEETGQDVARVAGLKNAERQYFLALVKKDGAKTPEEHRAADRSLLGALKGMMARGILKSQSEVLQRWYHLLVRETVTLNDFEANGDYIARKLGGLISPEQAEESFQLLLKNGFIRRATNTSYAQADPVLDTGDYAFQKQLMDNLHSETLKVWSQNLSKLDASQQERGLLNIPITEDLIPELQQRLRQFQDELIGWLQAVERPDKVVQLGIYLISFPGGNEAKKA